MKIKTKIVHKMLQEGHGKVDVTHTRHPSFLFLMFLTSYTKYPLVQFLNVNRNVVIVNILLVFVLFVLNYLTK